MRVAREARFESAPSALAPDSAAGRRFAIVAARFNGSITQALQRGAIAALKQHGADDRRICTYWVPGSFEIAAAALAAARTGRFDAVVCLGCLIRGETAHFDYIAQAAAHGIARVGLDTGVPCTFGVLTTENEAQALARAGETDNKGAEAALAAVEMIGVLARVWAEGGRRYRKAGGAKKRRDNRTSRGRAR